MASSPEFGMEKLNQSQKLNNKADGTPKTESKKVESYEYLNRSGLWCCVMAWL